jgi:spore maturation protein CgeB/chromosome segregation ATPase/glycosyltransferase involved in cell wall biosynthesis
MLSKNKQIQPLAETGSVEGQDREEQGNSSLDELALARKSQGSQQHRGTTDQLAVLKQRIAQEESARRAAEQALAQTSSLLEETQVFLQQERAGAQQQLAQWSRQEQDKGTVSLEAEKNRLRLEAELATVHSQLEAANQKYKAATEQVATLKQRVTQEEAAHQAAEKARAQAATQMEETQRKVEEARKSVQQQLAQSKAEGQAKVEAQQESEKKLKQLDADLTAMRGRLEEANQKYKAATEQIATLKQRVAQEEAAHQAAEKAKAQVAAQLEQAQRKIEEERKAVQQQLAQSKTEGQAKTTAAQESEKKIIRLDADLAAMRARLEEANQKYKAATEQIVTLKQRITQEEAMQQGSEKERVKAAAQLEEVQRKFQEERNALQQQLAQLSEAGQVKTIAVHEGEKKLIRLEAELEARSRLEEANQKYRTAAEQVLGLTQQVKQEETARKTTEQSLQAAEKKLTGLEAELSAVRSRLEEANQKYRAVTEQAASLKQRVTEEEAVRKTAEQDLQEAEKNRLRLDGELTALRVKLEEANQKYKAVTDQAAVMKQKVTQEEAARQAAEQGRAEITKELEQTRHRLQDEQAKLEGVHQQSQALTEQVAGLKQKVTQEEAARQAAEQGRVEITKELEQTRHRLQDEQAKLEGVHQQSQALTEQVAGLKQKVTQEEAARQAAEQGRVEITKELEQTRHRLQDEQAKLEGVHQQSQALTEQVAGLKQKVAQEEAARQAAEQAWIQTTAQLEQTHVRQHQERTALQQQLSQLITDGEAKSLAATEAEKKLLRLEGELATERSRLEAANLKYKAATEQVAVLKQRVTEEETGRQAVEQSLQEAQRNLEEERATLQQQLAHWSQREQAVGVAVQEAEKNGFRLESVLEAANQKYRSATEQVARLKEQVSAADAARQAAEQALEETTAKLDQANLKYRDVTGAKIPELKNKLKQLERAHQQKIAAEQQLVKTRASISFQLGYLLIHSAKSVTGVLRLPAALWSLRKETVQRRQKKTQNLSPLKLLPSATESLHNGSHTEVEAGPLLQEPISDVPEVKLPIPATVAAPLHPQTSVGAIPNRKLNIACIMDEFTFSSYQPEAILHQLTPGNWKAELEAANPDLLFIESAWRGKDELWGSKVGHTSVEVQGIVEWCREKNVPTVFWCKEDPIHFETFLNTAKLADHVFTTDIDCIHRYKAALGHNRVYLLPFACQPETNNPVEKYQRKDAFCFAGAYYVRYPERTRDLGDFVMELPSFRPLEIYDRNYGKNDPNYQFPSEYQPYIVGTLPYDQIDKAYKGYRYAINLNSIKQSQSMFARRVFELLGSNTITISNFSRGIRLLFGDLVITSDSGAEIVRRLKRLASDDEQSRKFRLAALRKVMSEHTYGQRLAYVVSKVSGAASEQSLPHIAVLAYAGSQLELATIHSHFQRQRYPHTSLCAVLGDGVAPPIRPDAKSSYIKRDQAKELAVDGLDSNIDLVAGMVAEDYYGPNYLWDIALATRYTKAELIGKAAHYVWEGGACRLTQSNEAYRPTQNLPARAAAIKRQVIAKENVLEWVVSLGTCRLQAQQGLAIDEFNYCEGGGAVGAAMIGEKVDDLPDLNTGLSIDNLLKRAEQIPPETKNHDNCPSLSGEQLAADFGKEPSSAIRMTIDSNGWRVDSTLPDGKHEYLYATADHSRDELGFTDEVKVYLDVTPGLNVQLVIVFLDAQRQKISHVIKQANRNQEAAIPPGTDRIRFGLRFYAGGDAEIKALLLGHRNLQPAEILSQAEHLILTNHYPSYDDLYRNGFIHTRVRAYQSRGVRCDVFRLRPEEPVSYHEFEDINAVSGSQEVLHLMLSSGRYKTVLVHFLDISMWEVLRVHIDRVKVIVWVHGVDIQPWHRRDFNHQTEDERIVARRKSDERMAFWRELLQPVPTNLRLVFVSRYSAEEAMEDLGFRIPETHYSVIHNPIETDLFRYEAKGPEQRKKVLSIRPYASRVYANDLSVKTIQQLAQKPWFSEMEFRMIGDGPLFEETLAPLRQYKNVHIEQRFLRRDEIAALHKEYGIFLCPSRMDTQGVSRDEAMASGLVPVTNAVTAIPEFVDESCGILVPGEDVETMAKGIGLLYEQPKKFSSMSGAAAKRVRTQSDAQRSITAELTLILGDPSKSR